MSDVRSLSNQYLRDVLTKDYMTFCRWVFASVRRSKFVAAEHHYSIADFLLELEREGGGGVINMPPRFGKTELAVVLWMAWTFARNPRAQFIHVSSGEDLALRNSGEVKGILQSPEFIELFPDCRIKPDTASKKLWETTAGGGVKAGSAGGVVTGFGAGRMDWKDGDPFDGAIIIDDPLKPSDALSDALRESVNQNLSQTLRSRRNHLRVPVLIIMQRLHVDDPTQYALDGKMAIPFKHLCLKARKDDGTALWPEKMPLSEMVVMEQKDRYTFASQYQQSPIPSGGNMVQLTWFGRYLQLPKPPTRTMVVHSWDTASKAGELNDPSCCTIWHVTPTAYYVAQVVVGRMEYPELKKEVIRLAGRDKPDAVLIEDKASGQSLIQDLRRETSLPVVAILPTADKVTRLASVSAMIEAGRVLLPDEAPWLMDYEAEITAFPSAKHDDQVDSTSQFLKWIQGRGTTESYEDTLKKLGVIK